MLKFKTKRVIVAMTDAEYDDLKALAQEQRLTVSAYVRWMIGQAIPRRKPEGDLRPETAAAAGDNTG